MEEETSTSTAVAAARARGEEKKKKRTELQEKQHTARIISAVAAQAIYPSHRNQGRLPQQLPSTSMSSSVDSGADALDTCDLRVFTLNIWGLKGVSAKRSERVKEIGEWLAASEFDVVLLQEVWLQEDFDSLRRAVRGRFQHAHFFDNGIIGTGTCIFSR